VDRLAEPSGELREHLSRFKDLVVADATVIRLRDALAGAYAACRTNHTRAAMKLHLVMSVFGAGARKVTVTGASTSAADSASARGSPGGSCSSTSATSSGSGVARTGLLREPAARRRQPSSSPRTAAGAAPPAASPAGALAT
jgi:hypothetical protein